MKIKKMEMGSGGQGEAMGDRRDIQKIPLALVDHGKGKPEIIN